MTISQNGWTASKDLKRRDLTVNGVTFVGGIRDDDNVEYVFRYFVEQYAARVEPLKNPGCWGFYFKPNANDHSVLSNHSSGTAIDINAPEHPNGVATARTFTPKEVAEVHKILGECHGALRWGGDYTHTVDAMHVEVVVNDTALLGVVKLMKEDQAPAKKQRPAPVRKALKDVKDAEKAAGPTQKKRLAAAKKDLKEINKR